MDAVNATIGLSTETARDRFGLFGRVGANVTGRKRSTAAIVQLRAGLSWERQSSTQNRSTLSLSVDQGFRAGSTSVGLVTRRRHFRDQCVVGLTPGEPAHALRLSVTTTLITER
jgi:hypothetical protein